MPGFTSSTSTHRSGGKVNSMKQMNNMLSKRDKILSEHIESLIKSLSEHKKFRQMAMYSIECLTHDIEAVNSEWRKNLEFATEQNAVDAVIEVMNLHAGKVDVLLCCVRCLSRLCLDSRNAEKIAIAKGLNAVFESIKKNPDIDPISIMECVQLVEKVSSHQHVSKILISPEFMQEVIDLRERFQDNANISISTLKTLNKLCKSQEGIDTFRNVGGVEYICKAMLSLKESNNNFTDGQNESIASECLALVQKLLKDNEESQKEFKDCQGIDALLSCIEKCPRSDIVSKIAGKLLTSLAGDQINDLIQEVSEKDPKAAEYALSLLASMSVDIESAEEIVNNQGISHLLSLVDEDSITNMTAKSMESIARTCCRLASNIKHINELLENNIFEKLILMLQSPNSNINSDLACIETLNTLMKHPVGLEKWTALNGLQIICDKFVVSSLIEKDQNPQDDSTLDLALSIAYLIHLEIYTKQNLNYARSVMELPTLTKVIEAMKGFPHSLPIQMKGTSILSTISITKEVIDIHSEQGKKNILLDVILSNLTAFKSEISLIIPSLSILSKILLLEPYCMTEEGFDLLVDVICSHSNENQIRKAASTIIKQLATPELIEKQVTKFKEIGNDITRSSAPLEEKDMGVVSKCTMTVNLLARDSNIYKLLQEKGMLESLVAVLKSITSKPTLPEGGQKALSELVAACKEMRLNTKDKVEGKIDLDLMESLITTCNKYIEATGAITNSIDVLFYLIAKEDMYQDGIDNDAIDAIMKVMKSYRSKPDIIKSTLKLLAAMSDTEEKALEIAKLQIFKPLLDILKEETEKQNKLVSMEGVETLETQDVVDSVGATGSGNISDSVVDKTKIVSILTDVVNIITSISESEEGKSLLSKQGAVSTLFDAMEAFEDEEVLVSTCEKAIQNLVTENDVLICLERLATYEPQFIGAASNKTLLTIKKDVDELGKLLLCGDFGAIIDEYKGGATLVSICYYSGACQDSQEKSALITSCIKSLGRAVGNIQIEGAAAIVPQLVGVLEEEPNTDVLRAVSCLARDEDVGTQLIEHNAVTPLANILHESQENDSGSLLAMIPMTIEALCSLGSLSSEGMTAIYEAGCLAMIIDFLGEHVNDIEYAYLVEKALNMLVLMAPAGENVLSAKGNNYALTDVLQDMLSRECPFSSQLHETRTALALLVGNLTEYSPAAASSMVKCGIIKQLMVIYNDEREFLRNENDTISILAIFRNLLPLEDIDGVDEIIALDGEDLLSTIIELHEYNDELVTEATRILTKIRPIPEDTISSLIPLVQYSLETVEQVPNEFLSCGLTENMQKLATTLKMRVTSYDTSTKNEVDENIENIEDQTSVLHEFTQRTFRLILSENPLISMDDQNALYNSSLSLLTTLTDMTEEVFSSVRVTVDEETGVENENISEEKKVYKESCLPYVETSLAIISNILENPSSSAPEDVLLACSCFKPIISNETAFTKVHEFNSFATLTKANKYFASRPNTEDLINAIEICLKLLKEMSLLHCQDLFLLPDGQGIPILLDIILSESESMLPDIIKDISTIENGPEILLGLLQSLPEMANDVNAVRDDKEKRKQIIEEIINCLINAKENKILIPITSQESLEALIQAVNYDGSAWMIYSDLALTPEGIELLNSSSSNAFKPILEQGLFSEDEVEKTLALTILAELASSGDESTLDQLIASNTPALLLQKINDDLENEEFIQNAVYILRMLADHQSLNLDMNALNILMKIKAAYPGNEYIQENNDYLVDVLKETLDGSQEFILNDMLNNVQDIEELGEVWERVEMEDGSVYYYNRKTEESVWEEPAGYKRFRNDLSDLIEMLGEVGSDTIEEEKFATLVNIMSDHPREVSVAGDVLKVLLNYMENPDQQLKYAGYINMQTVIDIANLDTSNRDLALSAMQMLSHLTSFEELFDQMDLREFLIMLRNIMIAQVEEPEVIQAATKCLANISKKSMEVAELTVELEILDPINDVIVKYYKDNIVATSVITFMTNMHVGGDNVMIKLCEISHKPLLDLLAAENSNLELVISILRLFGYLSLNDANVVTLTTNGATAVIVEVARQYEADVQLNTMIIQVLSNFGAIDDEDLDALATGHLIEDGGIDCIVDSWHRHKNEVSIIVAVLDALINIGNDEAAAETLTGKGVLKDLFLLSKTHAYDDNIVKEIVSNISVFSSFECGVHAAEECGEDVHILINLLTHFNDEEFTDPDNAHLIELLCSITNFCRSPTICQVMMGSDVVDLLTEVLSFNIDSAELIICVAKLFSRLSLNEQLALKIADKGIGTLMKICSMPEYKDDTEIVDVIFSLVASLTNFKGNLRSLVQNGVLNALVRFITIDKKAKESVIPDGLIVARAIRTLELIMTVDEEYTKMVIAMSVKKLVLYMMKVCNEDMNVQKAGDSIIKYIEMKGSGKSTAKVNRAALFARLGEESGVSVKAESITHTLPEPKEDPLAQHRTLLDTGAVLRVFTDGKGHNRHIFTKLADADSSAIVVKDPIKNNKGGQRLVLNKIKEIKKGCNDHHKKRSITGAITSKLASNESCSFYITSATGILLSLESDSEANRDRWVDALEKMIFVQRTWPRKLKPPN